jgi:hypothetical protein
VDPRRGEGQAPPGFAYSPFPVWLLLAALLLLLLPLVLLAGLILWPSGLGIPLLKMYFHIFVMIGSLSGFKLDISSPAKAGRDGPVKAGRDGREKNKITRIVMQ